MREFGQRENRKLLGGFLLLVAAFTLSGSGAEGQGISTVPSLKHKLTGLVGIADGQSARLNVINLSTHPVDVTLEIIDMNLQPIATENCARPDQQGPSTCMLTPGQPAHLEFNADQLGLPPGARSYLRAHVSVNPGANDVITTFEIFDNATGRAAVLAPCIINMN